MSDDIESLITRLSNASVIPTAHECLRAAALIEQQSKDIAALQSDIEAQIRIATEEATRAAELERDAELWRAHMREVERVKDLVRRGFGPAAKERKE
ncbi:hypothetical protein [Paraburkholderia tropica]|uniref:hypothetical protein n=1 Tax=Paraburkholderia tropica TaxID=92647 RepID=UPI002AB7C7AC|nr:hypothetical protein [Paraburkholderia tropica]